MKRAVPKEDPVFDPNDLPEEIAWRASRDVAIAIIRTVWRRARRGRRQNDEAPPHPEGQDGADGG
ncbi:MAG: hypothetical protein AAGA90_08015 [Actinomycetota bacterium]